MQRLRWCTVAALMGLAGLAWMLGGSSQKTTIAQDVRRPPKVISPRLPGGPAPAETPRTYAGVKGVHEKHHMALLKKKGIIGVGVTLDPADKTKHALRVFTTGNPKPTVPAEIDGVPVYEQYMVEGIKAYQLPIQQQFLTRPVPIGVSISNSNAPFCYSGTLGARLRRPRDGAVFMISNNHVLGLENDGLLDDPIQQPSSGDFLCLTDPFFEVGKLTHFVPLSFNLPNRDDVSIAQTTEAEVGTATPFPGYGTPNRRPFPAPLGTTVQKFGRTTGYRNGFVVATDVTIFVGYTNGLAVFRNQIAIINPTTFFGQPGDSGSLIVDDDNNPVALLFAGGGNVTFGNPIAPILAFYGMLVDDGGVFDPGTARVPPPFKRLRPIGPPQ